MADKTVIIRLDVQEAGASAQIQKLNTDLSNLTQGTNEYNLVLKKIAIQEDRLINIQNKRATAQGSVLGATNQATKSLNKQKDATGSATAATMELSRVVSDAPYGIRGMANNITQLVSQLGSAATKAGGLSAALKLMWKSMMGPLGVVFAITAVVSALDYFYGANKKAEKSSDDLTSALEKQKEELKELTKEYEDYLKLKEVVVMSTSKDREMLKALVTETLDLTNSEERRSESLRKLIELYPKYFKGLKIDDIKELFNAEKNVNSVLVNKLKLQDALSKAEIIANNIQLEKIKIKEAADKGNQRDLTVITKLYEEQKEVRDLIGVYAALNLELKEAEETKKEEASIIPRESVEALSFSDIEQRKKEMIARLKAIADAVGVDLKKSPISVAIELDMELSADAKARAAESIRRATKEIILNSRLDDAQKFLEKSKEILGSMTSFISGEYDREMTIEQNKTNALNQELNNRLLNENLSKDERAKIQNQIAQNDEKLRVKQDSINRKKFNAEKAANIAMTLMNTATAAVGVMKDAKGGFLARLAQAIPTIAFGLAQVATIARTKYQSMTPSTPSRTSSGGSGGGSGRAEPSFNIVGRSNENIILKAIQSQFDQPLKAYVVARDVTNQQQLDGIISNTSSI